MLQTLIIFNVLHSKRRISLTCMALNFCSRFILFLIHSIFMPHLSFLCHLLYYARVFIISLDLNYITRIMYQLAISRHHIAHTNSVQIFIGCLLINCPIHGFTFNCFTTGSLKNNLPLTASHFISVIIISKFLEG